MNFIRLGMSESTLLFYFYTENVLLLELTEDRKKSQACLINWLYTTSGFYDKSIPGEDFSYPYLLCKESPVYMSYMTSLMNFFLKNKERGIKNNLHFHDLPEHCKESLDSFKDYINLSDYKNNYIKNFFSDYKKFCTFIRGRNIVIINPMSELMKQQYLTGNVKKIYPDFPDISSITCYKNPYTFFNTGEDGNILLTKDKMLKDIQELIKDIEDPYLIISCGAYSNLLASDFPCVCTIGGFLLAYFGLKHKRYSSFLPYSNEEYWLIIPDNMKPPHYEKIENGCFW
jgi:hypothetical protein